MANLEKGPEEEALHLLARLLLNFGGCGVYDFPTLSKVGLLVGWMGLAVRVQLSVTVGSLSGKCTLHIGNISLLLILSPLIFGV